LFLIPIIFYSCEKDPSNLGLDLQPESDRVNGLTFETTVKAYTAREDSLTTDERTSALLGSYSDPVFGRSDAAFMTQIRLSTSNVSFGTSPVADSIVLYLDYRSYYGDTNTTQNISVFEIKNSLYIDSTYYSNLDPANYSPESILTNPLAYSPRPNDTVLTIKLNDELAQRIVATDPANLTDNAAFLTFFKGLYLKVDPILSNGAIIYFDLLSARSKVTLYYHNSSDTISHKFDFLINSSCARVNLFQHDYTLATSININDSTSQGSLLYLQAMSGLLNKIKLPADTLSKLNNIAIVKAELIIPVDNSNSDTNIYKIPTKLLLVCYNSLGKYEFVPDYLVGDSYFGGYYSNYDKSYHFNISRYVQQVINGYETSAYTGVDKRTDYGLALIVSDNRVSANRVVIKSPYQTDGMKLSITYLKP